MVTVKQSPFEVRFDALVSRLIHLARVAGGGTIGHELRDVADEMTRIRRDLAVLLHPDTDGTEMAPDVVVELVETAPVNHRTYRVPTPRPTPAPDSKKAGRDLAGRKGTQRVAGKFIHLPPGQRWCANHDEGEGKLLPISSFKVKDPKTGKLTSWCVECTRRYQQERYVRIGFKRVTAEVIEGDVCLGRKCPICHEPFLVGQRVQGSDVSHEECLDR